MYSKFFNIFFVIIFVLVIFSNILYFGNNYALREDITNYNFAFGNKDFSWPIPGFHNITSNFGTRIHPITGKTSSHSGIDISAPPGTSIYSSIDGIVTLAEFNGANGYSIHISSNELEVIYGHVSPEYIVDVGDIVKQNDIIGTVGPKYVDPTPNNTYKDSTGKFTNGSTTGPHLHFSIKKDGIAVNPLNYF